MASHEHTRTDVPALIAEVERLRKRVEAIEGITRSLTAEGFLQCDDETKRIVFAVACEEGERRKSAEARATAAEEERDNTINYLNDARDQYEAAQRINAELLARASAVEAKLAEAQDKIDGLQSELDSALAVLWRRGDAHAVKWVRLNYPAAIDFLDKVTR